MKIRTLAFAAAFALAGAVTSQAAPDPSLQLTYKTGSLFSTKFTTAQAFWDEFTSVFYATGYDEVLSSFSDIIGNVEDYANIVIAYNPKKNSGFEQWAGYLKFDGVSKISFASGTLTGQVFVSNPTVAVPGPEAGAGLGAVLLGGLAMWKMRRRQLQGLVGA